MHWVISFLVKIVLLLLAELLEGMSTFIMSEDRASAKQTITKPGQNCEYSHSRKQLHLYALVS